jgi:hypothetical protein
VLANASQTSTKTAATVFTTKKAAASVILAPPSFKPMPWALNMAVTTSAPTTTKPTTTTTTTKRSTTSPFDFDAFLEKEESEISSSEAPPKKLGLIPATDSDDAAIGDQGTASAPSRGGLTDLMSSARKLLSGLGFGGKAVPEKKVKPASDDGEASDSDGTENSDGEGDASQGAAEEALATPKKLDLTSLLSNAGDLFTPHLKTLGVGGVEGAAASGNPLSGLLGSLGGLFGIGKVTTTATEAPPA